MTYNVFGGMLNLAQSINHHPLLCREAAKQEHTERSLFALVTHFDVL